VSSSTLAARLAHPCFPQPADPLVKVWRYMSLPKLISLVRSDALHLARLDRFTDPYEGSTTERTVAGIDQFLKQLTPTGGYHEMYDIYKRNRESMFVSCWHANEDESEAMWRLYGTAGGSVAIQTTYSKLTASVEHEPDVYIGFVRYVDYNRASFPDANVFYPVMHKRRSFSHEREVRLVRLVASPEPTQAPTILTMPWAVETYTEYVYVDPYAPEYYFDAVHAVLEMMCPPLVSRLQWSHMKAAPRF
jgi:hypothetical protein